MPSLSKNSLERLATCHTNLQSLVHECIKVIDFTVVCGFRSEEEQTVAHKTGKSQLEWPNSKHNKVLSLAVDLVPYNELFGAIWNPNDLCYMAGHIMFKANQMGIKVRWGGDWNRNGIVKDTRFLDLPHFELME